MLLLLRSTTDDNNQLSDVLVTIESLLEKSYGVPVIPITTHRGIGVRDSLSKAKCERDISRNLPIISTMAQSGYTARLRIISNTIGIEFVKD